MAEALSDEFLSGQGIPVEVGAVEAELARLWGPAADREGAADLDHPTVTRIALANLVIANLQRTNPGLDAVIDTVVTRFPCRAIVLRQADSLGRQVKAEVSALCHLPAPGMPQVCSERILLWCGAAGLDLLPGAVRPLLEAELPVVLWWTDDPGPMEPLWRELAPEATRVLVDLPDPGTDLAALRLALDLDRNAYTRDVAWFGATRWRELVAQFFDPHGAQETLQHMSSVQIDAVAPDPSTVPRVSAWLAAWLAGQLGWRPQARHRLHDGELRATFTSPDGEVTVTIRTSLDNSVPFALITGVKMAAQDNMVYRLRREPDRFDEVRVEVDSPTHGILPRMVLAHQYDAPRRVAAGLESSRDDPPYRHALPHLFWLLES